MQMTSKKNVFRFVRRVFPVVLTGLVTGVLMGTVLEIFYRIGEQTVAGTVERSLSGWEALATFLVTPVVSAMLTILVSRERRLFRGLTLVAYLTAFIPLFGLGAADGSNIGVMAVGGTIGGTFWGLLVFRPLPVLSE